MVNLTNALIDQLGGIDGVAAALRTALKTGTESYSPIRSRCALAVMNMQLAIEANQPKQPLSEDEIEQMVRSALVELVRDSPQLVLAAAENLGWHVTAPTS